VTEAKEGTAGPGSGESGVMAWQEWVGEWRRGAGRNGLATGAVYLVFVIVTAVFVVTAPNFATAISLRAIGTGFAPICVVSVGMTFVILCAEIDLSVASTVSLAGLVGAVVLSQAGVPWPVGVLTSLAIGAAIGLINGFIVGYLGVPSFLVTLGTLEAIGAIALMATGTLSVPITSPGFLAVFGPGSFAGIPLDVWWAILVIVAAVYVLHFTAFGKWIYTVGDSRLAAKYAGLSKARILLIVLVVSGVLAAFGGVLLAGRVTAGDPTAGTDMELTAIAAVILGGTDLFGGKGTIIGTVISALFLSILQDGLVLFGMSAQMLALVTGTIIVLVVVANAIANGSLKR
jgi:ribose/xylose/arabinose/galactoside ABC-type transport system permease subunit